MEIGLQLRQAVEQHTVGRAGIGRSGEAATELAKTLQGRPGGIVFVLHDPDRIVDTAAVDPRKTRHSFELSDERKEDLFLPHQVQHELVPLSPENVSHLAEFGMPLGVDFDDLVELDIEARQNLAR